MDRRRRPPDDLRRTRRALRPAGPCAARRSRRPRRPAGRDVHVEQRRAPGRLPGRAEHGRRAAHAQPAALPGAADLHREPRRGPRDHRRLDADPAARAGDRRPAHGRARDRGRRRRRRRRWPRRPRSRCTRWDELLAGKPTTYDWPEVDERDAAALCYTSGTTGNPKGVAYSHRSIWLHSMQVCMAESFGLSPQTRDLVIVPMFHAMAWGLPYAAMMSGASAAHAGPVPAGRAARRDDRVGAADVRRRGADHLDRSARLPGRAPDRHLLADGGRRRRLGLPAGADARVRRARRRRSSTPGA